MLCLGGIRPNTETSSSMSVLAVASLQLKSLSHLKCSSFSSEFSIRYRSHSTGSLLGPLDDLDRQVIWLQSQAYAESTNKTRNSEYKALVQFCEIEGIDPRTALPLTEWQLCRFSGWLVRSGKLKSHDSVRQYLSALSIYCKSRGIPCPTPSQCHPLQRVLMGVRRTAQRPVKQSLPITPQILRQLLTDNNNNTLLSATQTKILRSFKALALIYFLSMLRSSNLIPPNRKKIELRRILTWGSLTRLGDSILIKVTLSKTIQYGERVQTIPLAPSDDPLFCPVRALENLARSVGHHNITPRTPVFQIPTRNGWTPIQRSDFDDWVKSRLTGLGLDASLFTLHGFRRGGIIELTHAEPNKALCMEMSGHSSEAFQVYCTLPAARRLHISRRVNAGLSRESTNSSATSTSSTRVARL